MPSTHGPVNFEKVARAPVSPGCVSPASHSLVPRRWVGRAVSGLIILFLFAGAGVLSPSQTFSTLATFTGSSGQPVNGAQPNGPLVQVGGNLYGTTASGGIFLSCLSGCGTIFSAPTSGGTVTTLYKLGIAGGTGPMAGLTLGQDGNLYGTTSAAGGVNGSGTGTIFKINTAGSYSTFYDFCSQDTCSGATFPSGLVQDSNGNFYGTTADGGNNCSIAPSGCGTVFMITSTGTYTTLYSFCSLAGCADGANPQGGLVLDSLGNLYGTTMQGGQATCSGLSEGCGTVFKLSGGILTTLHTFTLTPDGAVPLGTLLLGGDGNIYGTTEYGGDIAGCEIPTGCGVVFKVTPGGSFTLLHAFESSEGLNPYSGLAQGSDGTLYGTTAYGGSNSACQAATGCGTIFSIPPSGGALTILHSFSGNSDGADPVSGMLFVNGTLYGTSASGGDDTCNPPFGCGTVFSLTITPASKTATTTDLTVSPPSIQQGSAGALTLTATVSPNSGGGTPTGTITFFNGTTQLGGPENLSAGAAELSYNASSLSAGSYSITATYAGDANFEGSTSATVTLTVTQSSTLNPTTTTLAIGGTPSASQADVGSNVTLTASVSHTAGSAAPTGTITFSNGSTVLGTASLNGGGVATFSTSTLAANTYSVTAAYSGDSNYSASSSPAGTLNVVDFQIAANPTTITVSAPGQSGNSALTITPLGGFNQTLSYTCAGLPAGTNCSFSNTANGATMTITTTGSTSALVKQPLRNDQTRMYALLLPGLLGLLLAGFGKHNPRGARVIVLLCAAAICSGCVGCGGLGNIFGGGGGGNSGTPTGISTISVTATVGSLSHQATITLNVQ